MADEENSVNSLRRIRLAHTAIWAFFAGCIIAIPISSFSGNLVLSASLILVVFIEVIVLLLNNWSCPLTNIAAKYTEDRSANFDIYLPKFIASNNKLIFGWLYMISILYTLCIWVNTLESS